MTIDTNSEITTSTHDHLHRVRVIEVARDRFEVGPLEAIDGTPIVDIKPVLPGAGDH